MGINYCTREDIKHALDVNDTARTDAQIDRLTDAASRSVEALCHRRFYPDHGTRYFPWPDDQFGQSWRLWLGKDEVITVDTITTGDRTLDAVDYFLEPQRSGPPYSRVELDLSGSAYFGGGATPQRDIAITGTFGYTADHHPVTELAGVIGSSDLHLTVVDGSQVGVGALLLIGDEYLAVTGRAMADTGQVLTTGTAASPAAVVLAVGDGMAFMPGEVILIDGERMLVVDVAPDAVIVKRAWDGSVLAAHDTAATVRASRTLRVTRGLLGTTPTSHAGTTVHLHEVPGPVRELAIAETLVGLAREQSGYARTIGSGEAVRNASGGDIRDLREQVYTSHGRKVRKAAI